MDITIFDYEVTMDEMKHLFVKFENKEDYVRNTTYRKRLQDLYVLFKMRENRIKVESTITDLYEKNKLNLAS
jgi:hypothetical protein